MAHITLKAGRERSVLNRHPWVFAGGIATAPATPDGAAVDVRAANGAWLARGTWSSKSQIQVRLWTWQADEPIDEQLIRRRIERAVGGRSAIASDPHTTAYRLVFSESDGLPGLIADRYADWIVVQLSTVGAALRAQPIVETLAAMLDPRGIIERSDAEMRAKEGLEPADRVLWGDAPAAPFEVLENGQRYLIDLSAGHKTGAYLDQRINRGRVAAYCAGADVLSCFSYTGGFEIEAAAAGARSLVAIDSSEEALATAAHNYRLNNVHVPVEQINGNVFSELRRFRAENRSFDVIVLDPPKFVHSRNQIDRGSRGYKDINLLAMQLLRPGGILATFSCSGLVSTDLFQKIVWGAAVDARRDVQIIERLTQSPDHPVLLTFPEAEYLKGLICRVGAGARGNVRTCEDELYDRVLTFSRVYVFTRVSRRLSVDIDLVGLLERQDFPRAHHVVGVVGEDGEDDLA
jgi:23S rRNA (cytosine1962-C5)-methyltransferase